MCVICHKPAGTDMPSDADIRKMFKTNPHGAGFALQGDIDGDGGFKVEFHKGYMDVEKFLTAIHKRSDLKDLTVVMHFRIKTHGETDTYTTHPFKMSYNFNELRKLHGRGAVLFHNGVFSGLGGKSDPRASDTQDFVIGVAMRHLRRSKEPTPLDIAITSQIVKDCRVIILYPNKDYQSITFGEWHKHTDGCNYSNMLWNSEPKSYNHYYYGYGQTTPTSTVDIDEWGCNTARYAYPSHSNQWLNAQTQERWDILMNSAKIVAPYNEEKGYMICTFSATTDLKWYGFPKSLDLCTEKMLPAMEEFYDQMDMYSLIGASKDDEWVSFTDEEELMWFIGQGRKIGDYEYNILGKTWLIDVVNLEAYTEQGIKDQYKSGQVGHIIKNLRENGITEKTTTYHKSPARTQTKTEEDDLEAIALAHGADLDELDLRGGA